MVVAESYGGRDEPLDSLTAGFVAAGVEPLLDLRVKEEPSEAVYQVGSEWDTEDAGGWSHRSSHAQLTLHTQPTAPLHPPCLLCSCLRRRAPTWPKR